MTEQKSQEFKVSKVAIRKELNDLFFPGNAHLDPDIVNWLADLRRNVASFIDHAKWETDRVRSQGWKRWKSSGDQRIYFNRDRSETIWEILKENLKGSDLLKAVYKELKRRENEEHLHFELGWKLNECDNDYHNLPVDVAEECLVAVFQDPDAEKYKSYWIRKILSALRYELSTKTLKILVDKMAPYKDKEEKEEELEETRKEE